MAQRLDSLGADVQRIDAWLKEGFAARDAAALCISSHVNQEIARELRTVLISVVDQWRKL